MVTPENSPPTTDQRPPMPSPKKWSKKRLLIGGLILGLCVLIAGSLYGLHRSRQNKAQQANKNSIPTPPISKPIKPTDEFSSKLQSADRLFVAADKDGAIKVLEDYAPKVTDSSQIYAVASRLGGYYAAKGDWQHALSWYEKAQATGQPGSDSLYLSIADAAEKTGDKTRAIVAYQKLIDILAKNSSPVAKANVERYQAKIKDLGGA